MNKKLLFILVTSLTLLAGATLVAVTWAAPGSITLAGSGAPTMVSYQGELQVSDSPYSGDGYFKFAFVNAAGDTTYWSNDGTSTDGSEPTNSVQLAVNDGLFSVLLGDTTLGGMSQALTADNFSQSERFLRVWFSTSVTGTFSRLTPDTRVAAVPYALQAQAAVEAATVDGYEGAALEESAEIDTDIATHAAFEDAHHTRYTDGEAWAAVLDNDGSGSSLDADTVDGLHASQLGSNYQNVVVVAKSGGDFTSVQAAIDSISDAAVDKPYLVWIAPGLYTEQVVMEPYIHLQGAGQDATTIHSTATGSDWLPTSATLILANDASLRDLTVSNSGSGERNVALLASAGVDQTLVKDVTVHAQGSGTYNYAIFLSGSGTAVTLLQVTALAENGSSTNWGLYNFTDAMTTLWGGSYSGSGGVNTFGIYNGDSTTTLEAYYVTALAENGSSDNKGLSNNLGTAILHGGSFTGSGGTDAEGISSHGSGATLEAIDSTALGENSSSINRGLYNYGSGGATLYGGSFTAQGGISAISINNADSGTTLDAVNITALAEDGSNNYGLFTTGITQITQSVLEGATYSVFHTSGSVTISNSRLVGGGTSGTVTCVLVTRGTTVSTDGSTCP